MVGGKVTDYQYAYQAGYLAGRISQLNSEEYDDRTPLMKKRDTEGKLEETDETRND